MVIAAAAAITAAAYGTYRGGKAAVEATQKRVIQFKERRTRDEERKAQELERTRAEEADRAHVASLSFDERLAKYKAERGKLKTGGGGLRQKLFRKK